MCCFSWVFYYYYYSTLSKENHIYQEVIGYIKKCLNQQYEIRTHVYKGLLTLYKISYGLRESISSVYIDSLNKYISEDKTPCLLINKCLDGNKVLLLIISY